MAINDNDNVNANVKSMLMSMLMSMTTTSSSLVLTGKEISNSELLQQLLLDKMVEAAVEQVSDCKESEEFPLRKTKYTKY
jgi:hypothetical protein